MIRSRVSKSHIVLYMCFAMILIFLLHMKSNFYEDELLTYNLSNGPGWFAPEDGTVYSPAEKPFIEYLTSNGDLNLKRVWTRQRLDVHPPFYYMLVHIICCFFPYLFSKWIAGIINIIFLMMTLCVLRKICFSITSNRKIIDLISISYIFNAGILNYAVFLRMYVMLAFEIVFVTYVFVRDIDHYNYKTYIVLFLITIIGGLTHYYFIVFVFFQSVVVTLCLLKRRRIREIIGLVICMICSGGGAVAIFPSMIEHIFLGGYRGTESISNLKNTNVLSRINDYYGIINRELFGGMLSVFLFSLIIALVSNHRKEGTVFDEAVYCKEKYICIFVPIAGYFFIIAKSTYDSPSRYMYPIYSLFFVILILFSFQAIRLYICDEQKIINLFYLLMVITISCGLIQSKWDYLYLDSKEVVAFAEENGRNVDAICVYQGRIRDCIIPSYMELKNFKSATFYNLNSDEWNMEKIIRKLNLVESNDICIFCTYLGDYEERELLATIENKGYNIYRTNSYAYSNSYYFNK